MLKRFFFDNPFSIPEIKIYFQGRHKIQLINPLVSANENRT